MAMAGWTIRNNRYVTRKKSGLAAVAMIDCNLAELFAKALIHIKKVIGTSLLHHTACGKNVLHTSSFDVIVDYFLSKRYKMEIFKSRELQL